MNLAQAQPQTQPSTDSADSTQSQVFVPLYSRATSDRKMKEAPCRNTTPPSLEEMKNWLSEWTGTSQTTIKTHGVIFEEESSKMIDLFKKLQPYKVQEKLIEESDCKKVICSREYMEHSYSEKEWIQLLYMLARYGFNGSPLLYRKKEDQEFWKSEELDKILIALSDFPKDILPIKNTEGKLLTTPLIRHKRGSTPERLRRPRLGFGCISATDFIEVFDCADNYSVPRYQEMIFHEVVHVIGRGNKLVESSEWKSFAGWEGREDPLSEKPESSPSNMSNYVFKNRNCLTSQYGKENPFEDLAESAIAYRYNPNTLKKVCPRKYNYLKWNLFNGWEYSEGRCFKSEPPKKSTSQGTPRGVR